jgi:(2R)-sulfolactate sulfo-lyase subunit alpha
MGGVARLAVICTFLQSIADSDVRDRVVTTGKEVMIHFIVHDEDDSVGVVVVEGVGTGDALAGWIMDQQRDIEIRANDDIPIGHKLAITDLAENDTVIKYGTDIGRVVAPIAAGEHVHVHNLKTKRW